jgi:hypothetical protein
MEMAQKRIIRCDDYPYGDPRHIELFRKSLPAAQLVNLNNAMRTPSWQVMQMFEEDDIEYIWGVSPMLFDKGDIASLNHYVKKGKLVMHGFDHGVSVISEPMWRIIHEFYHLGGEYLCYENAKSILDDYYIADSIMQKLNRYDNSLFIPPFNAYNQLFLDAISNAGNIKKLFICDVEYEKFLKDLNHWDIQVDISQEGKSYTNVKALLENFDDIWHADNDDHICLHPMYDFIDYTPSAAADMYKDLTLRIRAERSK